MPISLVVRAALRMRSPRRCVLTVQTDRLDVTPQEAAELVRATESRFLVEVSVNQNGAVKIKYQGATSERMKVIATRVLEPHIRDK